MEALKYENFPYYNHSDYLEWEGSWELIEGIPYAMSPAPYPKHQSILFKISKELDKNLICSEKNCEFYIAPIDWKIDDSTVVQPDVALFCEDTQKQYFSKTPPLVVEVLSKATALKDVTTKLKLYEREGVQFYIIVEPNSEIGDIFELKNGEYELVQKVTKEDSYRFELSNGCATEIDFSTVYG